MSTLDADVATPATPVREGDSPGGHAELTAARLARVGDLEVRRLLPMRRRRSVGPWCFVDHYGPLSVDGVAGMAVPPHPHIGLATLTWLIEGNVLHRDSLGSEQLIRPGQVNLMTAGRGIAHSEESPADHDPRLHGVQLWLALPDADRDAEPAFEHHGDLPRAGFGGLRATVFAGTMADATSPARMFWPAVGAEITAPGDARGAVPLVPAHEHVLFVARGAVQVDCALGAGEAGGGAVLAPGSLLYLGPGRTAVDIAATAGAVLFLLGGAPLGQTLLMWWNFVARTPEEIAAAVADWQAGARFGTVPGYHGPPLPAPPLTAARLRRGSR